MSIISILNNLFAAPPKHKVTRKASSIQPKTINNHHGLYGKDVNGYSCEIMHCIGCDMAAHLHTIGDDDCIICGKAMTYVDGAWNKGQQRWVIKS